MNNYARKGMLGTALVGSLLFMSCSNTPAEQQDRMNEKMEDVQDKIDNMDASARSTFEADRKAVTDELLSLQDNIDNKLKEVNDKLAKTDLKAGERTEAEAMKAELAQEKAQVSTELDKVRNATSDTWTDVKAEANKASEDVKGWWEKLKDNVDQKTDADKDNDGH